MTVLSTTLGNADQSLTSRRREANQRILKHLTMFLDENPGMRFSQALTELNIIRFDRDGNVQDDYNRESMDLVAEVSYRSEVWHRSRELESGESKLHTWSEVRQAVDSIAEPDSGDTIDTMLDEDEDIVAPQPLATLVADLKSLMECSTLNIMDDRGVIHHVVWTAVFPDGALPKLSNWFEVSKG